MIRLHSFYPIIEPEVKAPSTVRKITLMNALKYRSFKEFHSLVWAILGDIDFQSDE